MSKNNALLCICVIISVLCVCTVFAAEIDAEQIKGDLTTAVNKCALGEKPTPEQIGGSVDCLCKDVPLKIIEQIKSVCAANELLEKNVNDDIAKGKQELVGFIKSYVKITGSDLNSALLELKTELGKNGTYLLSDVRTVRVAYTQLQGIIIIAALQSTNIQQLASVNSGTDKEKEIFYTTIISPLFMQSYSILAPLNTQIKINIAVQSGELFESAKKLTTLSSNITTQLQELQKPAQPAERWQAIYDRKMRALTKIAEFEVDLKSSLSDSMKFKG